MTDRGMTDRGMTEAEADALLGPRPLRVGHIQMTVSFPWWVRVLVFVAVLMRADPEAMGEFVARRARYHVVTGA